jgi:hypothetical protein
MDRTLLLLSSARKSSSCSISDGVMCAFTGTERFSRLMNKNPGRTPGENQQGETRRRSFLAGLGGSCGLRVQQAGFGLQLAAGDLLQLELAKCRRIFSPPRDAALLNAEGLGEERLRLVVLDGFLSRHI